MALQAQEWTVSALSVEFKTDRRTVAKRLENIKPHRTEGVAKYYLMVDAAPALLDSAPKLLTEDGEVVDFYAERTRLTKEQADKVEMENGQLREELIRWAAVKRMIEMLGAAANTHLGALPAKIAPIVRPDNPAEARRILERAIEEAREEPRRTMTERPVGADAARRAARCGRRGRPPGRAPAGHGGGAGRHRPSG